MDGLRNDTWTADGGIRQSRQKIVAVRSGAGLQDITGKSNWLSRDFGGDRAHAGRLCPVCAESREELTIRWDLGGTSFSPMYRGKPM